jgi:HJR/Mrr/RecB family endonuclease
VCLPELGTEWTLVLESLNVGLYVVPHVHLVRSHLYTTIIYDADFYNAGKSTNNRSMNQPKFEDFSPLAKLAKF